MTREERDTFLSAARIETPRYALLFELLAKTGLRPSEAYALQDSDLDLGAKAMRVERAYVMGRIRPTKTHQTRVVDLATDLADALRRRGWAVPRQTRRGKAGPWLFKTTVGTPLSHSRVGMTFRSVAKKAGLPGHRLYDLRHTYACLLLADGAPITYVAAQLGHATPDTTLRHYARWIPGQEKRWVQGS